MRCCIRINHILSASAITITFSTSMLSPRYNKKGLHVSMQHSGYAWDVVAWGRVLPSIQAM